MVYEAVPVQVAREFSGVRDGYYAGLFRYYDAHRIRLLGQPYRGPVPGAEQLAYIRVLRQREEAAGRYDSVAVDDHAPVMQGCIRHKDSIQKFARDDTVQLDAALGVRFEAHFPLHRDYRADLFPCVAGVE